MVYTSSSLWMRGSSGQIGAHGRDLSKRIGNSKAGKKSYSKVPKLNKMLRRVGCRFRSEMQESGASQGAAIQIK